MPSSGSVCDLKTQSHWNVSGSELLRSRLRVATPSYNIYI
uniref:Uncharacterized protein n=1 Tax=Rhizophora mucronata TaxID=61149 RepID=A0A2P2NAZ2_RHIMU